MSSDPRILTHYLHVNTVQNIAIYRALSNIENQNPIRNDVLRILTNSAHDVAVIQWCSLFGSNTSQNPTHWARTERPWIKDRQDFIDNILGPIEVSFDEWKSYHTQLLEYRNKNIAHIQVGDWYRNVPIFDLALNVLFQSYRALLSDPDCEYNLEDEYKKIYQRTIATVFSDALLDV